MVWKLVVTSPAGNFCGAIKIINTRLVACLSPALEEGKRWTHLSTQSQHSQQGVCTEYQLLQNASPEAPHQSRGGLMNMGEMVAQWSTDQRVAS